MLSNICKEESFTLCNYQHTIMLHLYFSWMKIIKLTICSIHPHCFIRDVVSLPVCPQILGHVCSHVVTSGNGVCSCSVT